jgi:hypothetical protein
MRSRLFKAVVLAGAAMGSPGCGDGDALPGQGTDASADVAQRWWPDIGLPPDIAQPWWPDIGFPPDIAQPWWPDIGVPRDLAQPDLGADDGAVDLGETPDEKESGG